MPIEIRKKFQGSKEKIASCPNCHRQHKVNRTGEYCTMTCFYAKLESDRKNE